MIAQLLIFFQITKVRLIFVRQVKNVYKLIGIIMSSSMLSACLRFHLILYKTGRFGVYAAENVLFFELPSGRH